MSSSRADAMERVRRLVAAARQLADASSSAGVAFRRELSSEVALSAQGIELAIASSLETRPSDAELTALVASQRPGGCVWVVLSRNVFTSDHRAIALALATGAPRVKVRHSRSAGALARALHRLEPTLFELVDTVEPALGDQVHAYGSDETLASLRASLPPGTSFFGHGHGFGVQWVAADEPGAVERLVDDVVLFDQAGCLSPKVVVLAPRMSAWPWCEAFAQALAARELSVPLGAGQSQAESVWFREVAHCVGTAVWRAGSGSVVLQQSPEQLLLPPSGRNIVVLQQTGAPLGLGELARWVTTVGIVGPDASRDEVRRQFPWARLCAAGEMQRPRFDGPVDLRSSPVVV